MPKKDFTCDVFIGVWMLLIASIFFLSGAMPWLVNVRPENLICSTLKIHFSLLIFKPFALMRENTFSKVLPCCSCDVPQIIISSLIFFACLIPVMTNSIWFWKLSNALLIPYMSCLYWYTPPYVANAVIGRLSSSKRIWCQPSLKSNLLNVFALFKSGRISPNFGMTCLSHSIATFGFHMSKQRRIYLSIRFKDWNNRVQPCCFSWYWFYDKAFAIVGVHPIPFAWCGKAICIWAVVLV